MRPRLFLCVFRRVRDHHDLLNCSPLLKNTCVRQVVLDKLFPLIDPSSRRTWCSCRGTTRTSRARTRRTSRHTRGSACSGGYHLLYQTILFYTILYLTIICYIILYCAISWLNDRFPTCWLSTFYLYSAPKSPSQHSFPPHTSDAHSRGTPPKPTRSRPRGRMRMMKRRAQTMACVASGMHYLSIYQSISIYLSLSLYIYIYVSLSTYIHIYIYIYTYRIIMYGNCNNLVPPPSNPTPSHQRLLSPTLTDMNTFGVCSPLPHLQHVTLWIASPYYSYTYRTNFSQVSYG